MKMTLTDILNQYLRNIGLAGTTDASILADFYANLAQRYNMILAKLHDYMVQKTISMSTVAGQQYYFYPNGIVNIESIVVTIGNVHYPTGFVNSQYQWDWLNSLTVQPTAIPQFVFPRRDDFGIYPIPGDIYDVTFNFHYRDRGLTVADYTTGTVTVTNNSATVTGAGTTFTPAMVGRFLQVVTATNSGYGYFYRIAAYVSATEVTLQIPYEGATGGTLIYRIGQCPEIPDEGHIILVDGITADFYSGIKHDAETSTWFNNKFFTGDGQNGSRKEGDNTIAGGLIGLYNQYTDRNMERVIERKKEIYPFMTQNWGMSLT